MGNPAWPTAADWRRVHAAARPVLDDPTRAAVVERLVALLDSRIQHLEREPGSPDSPEARVRLLTRIATRYLQAVTTRADARSSDTLPLLFLAAAYRLRVRYAS